MPKLVNEVAPLIRVHLLMDKGDWQTWRALFDPNIGTSKALRLIMRDYIGKIERAAEDKAREAASSPPPIRQLKPLTDSAQKMPPT